MLQENSGLSYRTIVSVTGIDANWELLFGKQQDELRVVRSTFVAF